MLLSERCSVAFASVRKPGFFIIVLLAFAGLLFIGSFIRAAQVTQTFSVIVARPIVATTTAVLFSFKPAATLTPGTSIVFEIDPAYGVPASVTPADGSLTVDGVPKTLGAGAGNGVYGYAISGHSITLTMAANENISAGATVELLVGRELGIVTPAGYGTSQFGVRFYDQQSQLLGGTQAVTILVPPIGVSASASSTDPEIRILNLRPELTSSALNAQNFVNFFVTVRYSPVFLTGFNNRIFGATDNRNQDVYRDTETRQVDANGSMTTPITLYGASDGTYDVSIKTLQHLSRSYREAPLVGSTSTDLDYSTSSLVLLGGDINGDGTTPDTYGDDVANAVDISLLTSALDEPDPNGISVRANLNHDQEVNSVDLSILLKNLDLEGDLRH
ncbi:hypothetical protein K8R04_01450 [Candidatus Uhrbacteria bacterium]|nr:hypothetical protein [Candidatus Uhrbacteria bacterium]